MTETARADEISIEVHLTKNLNSIGNSHTCIFRT